MPTVSAKAFIARSPAEVFDFVSNQENAVKWQSGLAEVRRVTDGPVGVGSRHAFVRKVLGREMVAENEYVAYVPGEKVTFKTVSGPIDLQACYAVTASGDGTDLSCTLDLLKGRGFARLFLPLIAKNIQKQMSADFVRLKALLEER